MKKYVSIDDFKIIGLVHKPLIYLISTHSKIHLAVQTNRIIVFEGSGGGK